MPGPTDRCRDPPMRMGGRDRDEPPQDYQDGPPRGGHYVLRNRDRVCLCVLCGLCVVRRVSCLSHFRVFRGETCSSAHYRNIWLAIVSVLRTPHASGAAASIHAAPTAA